MKKISLLSLMLIAPLSALWADEVTTGDEAEASGNLMYFLIPIIAVALSLLLYFAMRSRQS